MLDLPGHEPNIGHGFSPPLFSKRGIRFFENDWFCDQIWKLRKGGTTFIKGGLDTLNETMRVKEYLSKAWAGIFKFENRGVHIHIVWRWCPNNSHFLSHTTHFFYQQLHFSGFSRDLQKFKTHFLKGSDLKWVPIKMWQHTSVTFSCIVTWVVTISNAKLSFSRSSRIHSSCILRCSRCGIMKTNLYK